MVKLGQLKVDQLKKELALLELSTMGSKAELQQRLREACEMRGIDLTSHEFVQQEVEAATEVELIVPTVPAIGADMSQLLAAMQSMMSQQQKLGQQLNENSTNLERRLQNNSVNLEQLAEGLASYSGQLNAKFVSLEESVGDLDKRVEELEKSMVTEYNEVLDKRVEDLEKSVNERLHSLQLNGTIQRIRETSGVKLKPPTYDGTTAFNIFRLQFETTATQNVWSEEEKAAALIVALKVQRQKFYRQCQKV